MSTSSKFDQGLERTSQNPVSNLHVHNENQATQIHNTTSTTNNTCLGSAVAPSLVSKKGSSSSNDHHNLLNTIPEGQARHDPPVETLAAWPLLPSTCQSLGIFTTPAKCTTLVFFPSAFHQSATSHDEHNDTPLLHEDSKSQDAARDDDDHYRTHASPTAGEDDDDLCGKCGKSHRGSVGAPP